MTWTRTRPTQPGYWWRRAEDSSPCVVFIYTGNGGLTMESEGYIALLENVEDGEWSDQPIPMPKEAT